MLNCVSEKSWEDHLDPLPEHINAIYMLSPCKSRLILVNPGAEILYKLVAIPTYGVPTMKSLFLFYLLVGSLACRAEAFSNLDDLQSEPKLTQAEKRINRIFQFPVEEYQTGEFKNKLTSKKNLVAVFSRGDLKDPTNPLWQAVRKDAIENLPGQTPTEIASKRYQSYILDTKYLYPLEILLERASEGLLPFTSNVFEGEPPVVNTSEIIIAPKNDNGTFSDAELQNLSLKGLKVVKPNRHFYIFELSDVSEFANEFEAINYLSELPYVDFAEPNLRGGVVPLNPIETSN